MYTLTTSGGSRVAAVSQRPPIRLPGLRGPLVAAMVVALITSVSALIPSISPDAQTGAADTAAAATAATAAQSQVVQAGEVPDGLTAAEWSSIQRQIAAAGAVEAVPAAVSRSAVPTIDSPSAAGFAAPQITSFGTIARFQAAGAAVAATGSDTTVVFRTSNVGEIELGATDPAMVNGQAHYLHTPAVTETYRDTADGLQQLFTIAEPVTTADTTVIEVEVESGTPTLLDPQTVRIVAADGERFIYRDLIAWDTTGASLAAAMDVVDGAITLNVDTAGAQYPITIDPTITEDNPIGAYPNSSGEASGTSVAIDVDTVVVASPFDDDIGLDRGKVEVWDYNAGTGSASYNSAVRDGLSAASDYGYSVDVEGDTFVVGAPGDSINGVDAGAVYVYTRGFPGDPWGLKATLYACTTPVCDASFADATFAGERFGEAVALTDDGQTILVGAPQYGIDAGRAFVIDNTGPSYNVRQILRGSGTGFGDAFGAAVDIAADGSLAIVGAPMADYLGESDSGLAYVYSQSGPNLAETYELDPSFGGTSAEANFGAAVAIDHTGVAYAVVAEPFISRLPGDVGGGVGTVFVYDVSAPADITPLDSFGGTGIDEGYGYSVSAEQDHVVVGFPFWNDEGRTEVLERSGASFSVQGGPPPGLGEIGSQVGASVSIGSNLSVAIGQPGIDNFDEVDGGTVRVQDDISNPPPVEYTIDSSSDTQYDQFGFTVAIEGNRMAVTAAQDDEPDPRSGSVQIYERADEFSPWVFQAIIVDPNPTSNGLFGDALALNGGTLAIGKSDRWVLQASPGEVSVFTGGGSTWTLTAGTPLTSGLVGYDGFGASLALPDENTLIVGAPAAGGTGAVYHFSKSGSWSAPTAITYVTPPSAGDQLGFSLDTYPTPGGYVLAVGAPGDDAADNNAGAVWIHDSDGGVPGFLTVVANSANWDDGDRVGTSIAADHGRIVAAGAGNQSPGADFQVHVIEFTGSSWDVTWSTGTTLAFAVSGVPNDYVDIHGGTIALGRPGGGGQVALFRYNGVDWPAATPDDLFIATGTTGGDRFGHSVDIDSRLLAAGAPGDGLTGANSGAVFEVEIPLVATFTGAVDADYQTPGNWDVGVVPLASDAAVIPAGSTVEVSGFVESGNLTLLSGAQINVLNAGHLSLFTGWSGSPSQIAGTIEIQSGGRLSVPSGDSVELVGGTIDNLDNGEVELNGSDEAITIVGSGTWNNAGALTKLGNDPVTIATGITWISDTTSDIVVANGELAFLTPVDELGSVSVEAGASIRYADSFSALGSSVLAVGIDGPGASTSNYGQVLIDSLDAPFFDFATLRTFGGYSPVAGDEYRVISCYDCGSPDLFYDIGSLEPGFDSTPGDQAVTLLAPSVIVVDTLDGLGLADGFCSLREAITAANDDTTNDSCSSGSGADTIVFSVPGTIPLLSPLAPIDTDLIVDGQGQDITISGQDSTAILSVAPGGAVDLLDLTIADGAAQPCTDTTTCGAVLNEGILNVAWVTFAGNGATNGAAITNDLGGQLNVSYSTFVQNSAGQNGGAIWNRSGDADIANSTFYDNFAGAGGAVLNDASPSTTVITNSTFSDNGAELAVISNAGAGSMVLRNTIVESTFGFDCAGTIDADGFNIDTDGTCGSATTSSSLNLQPLADNGGPTQTVALGAGSAAFDAADPVVCAASPVFGVDQRGEVRPQGAGCDSGAYESNGTPGPVAITIDTLADDNVVNGNCTVREAILAANSDVAVDACSAGSGADVIAFDLPGAGPFPLSLTSPLPAITETVTIDGYSQPGSSANTLAVGSDAVILIELDGSSLGGANGLDFSDPGSDGSVVQGLAVNGFAGYAIVAGPGTQIRGNHIGTDAAGTSSLANNYGVLIGTAATQPVTVGGTTPADRNVIAGNVLIGIQVLAVGGTTADTTIVGNYIGTDATGTAALPNGSEGIWIGADPGSLVAGTSIGDGTSAGRNVISGNSGEGIAMWDNSTSTVIRGNYIGVGADGTTPLGNALSVSCGFCFGGITIRNNITNNTVGGNLPGDGNLIANNPTGVIAFSGWNNRIIGNSIFDNLGNGLEISPLVLGEIPPNDPGDPDGLGFAQNFPLITPIISTGGNLQVGYSIDSIDGNSAYPIQIDVYEADSAVSGEGKTFLGRSTIDGPGSDSVDLGAAAPLGILPGDPIVATATDANGNTSNFSPVAAATLGPCTTSWTNGVGDDSWENPLNWTAGVPGVSDVVCLDDLAGASVNIAGTHTIDSFDTAQEVLSILGSGSLTVSNASTIDGQVFITGTLQGDGEITLTADSLLNGGTILGSVTVGSGSIMNAPSGSIDGSSGGTFTIDGTMQISGDILIADGANIVNNSTMAFGSNATQVVQISTPFTSTITNNGEIFKSGTGTLTLPSGLTIDMASGSSFYSNVNVGPVNLFTEGTWTGLPSPVTVRSESGASINIAGSQTMSGQINGLHTSASPGKVIFSGTKTTDAGTTLNFPEDTVSGIPANGMLEFGLVNLTGSGIWTLDDVTYAAGPTNMIADVTNNGVLSFAGASTVQGTLTSPGAIGLAGSTAYNVGGTGTIDLSSGALWTANTSIAGPTLAVAALTTDSSTVIDLGVGTTTIDPDFTSNGSLSVGSGSLLFTNGAVVLAPSSTTSFDIIGPSSGGGGNFGQWNAGSGILDIGGELTRSGVYSPTPVDSYAVIIGCDCPADTFDTLNVPSFSVDIGLNNIVLSASPFVAPPVVAIDGEWAVITVPSQNEAFVMRRVAGAWTDFETISGAGITGFGESVAISDPWLVIGSPASGRVDYYRLNGATFNNYLTQTDIVGYGSSLDLDDGRLIIGSPFANGGALGSGNVVVWDLPTSTPLVTGVLVGSAGDQVGYRVAIAGNSFWATAPNADPGAVTDAGAVYRFDLTGTLQGTITAPTPTASQQFGWEIDALPDRSIIGSATSVSVVIDEIGGAGQSTLSGASTGFGYQIAASGDLLAINDVGDVVGHIYGDNGDELNYTELATPAIVGADVAAGGGTVVWVEEPAGTVTSGNDIATFIESPIVTPAEKVLGSDASANDRFGTTVAIDGDTMLVSAPGADFPTAQDNGRVYLFKRVGGIWTEENFFSSSPSTGTAVAVDGTVIAFGGDPVLTVLTDNGGGSYAFETGPVLTTAPRSIAIEGDTLVVGLPAEGGNAGAVHVYSGGPSSWGTAIPQVITSNAPATATDRFGWSIDIDGDRLIIGAPAAASIGTLAGAPGYVEFHGRPDGTSPFVRDSTLATNGLGWSVAVDSDRFAVGAPASDSVTVLDDVFAVLGTEAGGNAFGWNVAMDSGLLAVGDWAGTVTTFDVTGTSPALVQANTHSDFEPQDNSNGTTQVAISNGTIVSGARLEDQQGADAGAVYVFAAPVPDPGLVSAFDTDADLLVLGAASANGGDGAAYIYRHNGTDWILEQAVAGPVGDAGGFGSDVAVDNGTVFVGAPDNSTVSGTASGAVFIYRFAGTWAETDTVSQDALDADAGDQFGAALDATDSILWVGAPGDDEAAADAGAAYRFNGGPSLTSWGVPVTKSVASDASASAVFGSAIGARGKNLAIGAPGEAGGGQAYVLVQAGNGWPERAILQSPNRSVGDTYGAAVAVMGHSMVITDPSEDLTGTDQGAAYIYDGDVAGWALRDTIEGGLVDNGAFGASIDAIGDLIVAGATGEDGGDGAVHLFERTNVTWNSVAVDTSATAGVDPGYGIAVAISADFLATASGTAPLSSGAYTTATPPHPAPTDRIAPTTLDDYAQFGFSIAMSGDTAVVGAPSVISGIPQGRGSAYVFRNVLGVWQLEQELVDPDPVVDSGYGYAVAIDTDTLAVGSWGSGIWIWTRSGSTWTAATDITSPATLDSFGAALDLDGASLIVGAPRDDDAAANAGTAYVYTGAGATWTLESELPSTTATASDFYGESVTISGDTAVVGIPRANDGPSTNTGAFQVWTRAGAVWTAGDTVVSVTSADGDFFGANVAIDGDKLIVGAPFGNAAGNNNIGWVYFYEISGGSATFQTGFMGQGPPFGGSQLGESVAIDGNLAVAGSIEEGGADANAFTYGFDGTQWFELDVLAASDAFETDDEYGDRLGAAVAISGTDVVVGADLDDTQYGAQTGSAYTFVSSPAPEPAGKTTDQSAAAEPGDLFGFDVAVSDDVMVVGAPEDIGFAGTTGDAGNGGRGEIHIFDRVAGDWVYNRTIDGPVGPAGNINDGFGRSLDISGDWIIVGAPRTNDPGDTTGRVHFIDMAAGDAVQTVAPPVAPDININFGVRVAIDGTTAAVGATTWGTSDGGQVLIYELVLGTWTLVEQYGASGGYRLGRGIDIDGDRLAFGTLNNAGGGFVVVADRVGGVWPVQTDPFNTTDPQPNFDMVFNNTAGTQFGIDIALDGDNMLIGAPNAAGTGIVEYRTFNGSSWDLAQTITPTTSFAYESFGYALDLDGQVAVIGARRSDTAAGSEAGAAYVFNESAGTFGQVDELFATDAEANANFGFEAKIDGSEVLIGAPADDNGNGADAGAVYTFDIVVPAPDGRIFAPDAAAGDYFGQSVDIHDDWMVVGARQGDGVSIDTGSAYVFRRILSSGEWEYVTELEASDGATDQWFGASVAISGTRFDDDGDLGNFVIAVGAPDLFGATDGAVYLYRYDFVDDDWVFTRKIDGPAGSTDFGFSVALEQTSDAFRNGTYALATGAPSLLAAANPGAAYLYRYTITENPSFGDFLTLIGTADSPASTSGALHGFAVALDGDSMIVSEPNAPDGALLDVGRAHVYRYDVSGGPVVLEGTLTQPAGDVVAGDNFGRTADIDGDLAVVGSLFDMSGGPGAGAAYVYRRDGSTWGAAEQLVSQAPNTANFGLQARVEDGLVAVSAFDGGSNDAGTVQIFEFDVSDGWVTGPALEWANGYVDTNAGSGLALGEDGVLAVGAAEDDNAGGVDAGAVQVFDVSVPLGGNKFTTGQDIDLAEFGGDVDVDGEWAIVGATGAGAGAVGSALMFRKVAGEWQLFQELDDPNPGDSNDDYGAAVAVGGDFAAVADQGDDHVFWFNGTSWVLSGDFYTPGFDTYSVDLAIDGANDRLIVGYGFPGAVTGQVDIYDLAPFSQPTANSVSEPGPGTGTFYANNVAIEGDLAFATAERDSGNDGSVVVFERSGTNWAEVQVITPPVGAAQLFGSDLDVDGNRLIVGQSVANRAWIFENVAGTWTDPVELNSSVGQGGRAVSISGDIAVVGAPRATIDGLWAGSADVFARAGEAWVLADTVSADDREFGDAFAAAVSLDGSDLFVGAQYDTNIDGVIAGAAYVYFVEPPDFPEFGSFDFGAVTSPAVSIASTGFPADNVTTSLVDGDAGEGSVASTPLSSIDVDQPVGTDVSASPVASLTLDDLPLLGDGLTAAGVESPLDSIPLTDLAVSVPIPNTSPIEIGGWEYIFSQVALRDAALGAQLLQRPLQNITFGEVKALPEVAELQLDEISVAGTPVASLPVASLVLGSIPVASLPTEAGQTQADTEAAWCDALAGTEVECGGGALNQDLTLFEITIAGVPVASLPVASLPVASLPVASLPVASLPVASLDLAASPVASLPVASLPVASLPVASLPVASLPVASLPVASLPVASLPTTGTDLDQFTNGGGTLASVPVASLYLQGVPVASLPVASLPVASLPVASLPVASLPVASLPVASLPVASLPVASLDLATLDVSGTPVASLTTDGTLATLPVASLPVASLPVASLPVASLPVASLPVASLPVASLPVASLPVASLPVASLDVTGTPVASLTTDGTLATLPVASLDLAALPVASLPVASLPVASLSTVVDCSSFDCTDPDSSLADALLAAPVAGATLADLIPLLGGVRWGDLLFAIGLDIDEFAAVVAGAQNNAGQPFTLADIVNEGGGFDTLTLGELPDSALELLLLGDIAEYLTGLRLSDLLVLFDQGGVQLDPVAVEQAITDAKNALTNLLFGDLLTYDDLVLADLPDLNGLSLGEIAPFLTGVRFDDLLELFAPLTAEEVEAALITVLTNSGILIGDPELDTSEMTIGDLLSGDDLGGLTLGDLLLEILAADPNALDDITLGDLLLAFVSPTDYPWEDVAFDEVDTATLPGVVGSVGFETSFDITSTERSQQVEVSVIAPGTASYLPGTATLDGDPLDTEPVQIGDALVWTLSGLAPDTTHVLGFDLQPTLDLGTSVISTEARIVGVAGNVTATSNVTVGQAFEINDTPPQATPLDEDTLYLTHIPTADDIDYFQIDVSDGDRLIVNLSNLDADLDVLVYGQSEAASIVPLVPPSGQSAGGVLEDPEFELDGTTQVTSEVVNDAPVAAGLPVVATGNRRGVAAETVVTPPLEAGTVYVQVYGANGASSPQPAVLQARITQSDDIPPCSALSLTGGVPGGPSSVPADANTLILVNQERISALYPSTYENLTHPIGLGGPGDPGGELEQLMTFLNGPGAGLGIVPGIVNVDTISGIGSLYSQWDANPCDPVLANNVVGSIAAEITQLRATRSIDHIMVIGGDDVIPMARVVDGTEISNEYDYRYTFGGNNAIAGAAWASQLLTDEPYGDTAALGLGDRFLYITDTALGRLVESPDEIAFQLDQFETSQGFLNPATGLVVGYDFLDDGSEAIAADLAAAGLTVDDEYGTSTDPDNWSAQDLADKLFPAFGTTPDIISLNAHFDHRRALPALGNLTGDESELFQAQTVFDAAPGSLTGRVAFSMGCHSSLSVSDQTIGVLSDDFAQAFTKQGGIYVGNTGYGYGDTETVAYSERLMELFAEQLVNPILLQDVTTPTTAGQALQYAKNDFFAELGVVSVYDEKALMESTFYGIPFYRIGLDTVPAEPAPDTETVTDPVTGDEAVSLTVAPTNSPVLGLDDGVKFVNFDDSGDPLEQKAPFNPAQPLEVVDVTVVDPADSQLLGTVARGVLLVGMASDYFANDPVIVKPITDGSAIQPEPDIGDVLFPAKPAAIRTTEQPEGTRQSIALSTGQFRGSSTSGIQRLDERIDLVVYYSPASEDDFTPPTIRTVSSVIVGDQLTVSVDASDTGGLSGGGTDVDRIYVLVAPDPGTGPIEWIGLNLVRDTLTGDRWVGSIGLPSGTDNVEFIVQAKDGAGNVGYATNKAGNFSAAATPPPPPPPELEITVEPGEPGVVETNGWFDGPVLVEADIPGVPLDYQLDGGPRTPLTPAGVLVEGQGSHVLEIFTSPDPDEEPIEIIIRIDTAPPTAVVASPADGAIVAAGAVGIANYACQDPSLQTCTATLDGSPVAFGTDLDALGLAEGEHTIIVTAVDAVGNTVTNSATFTIESAQAPPTVVSIASPTTPQLISDGVEIAVEFDDPNNAADDYTMTVDWGNLDDDGNPGSSDTCVATSAAATIGNPSCSIDTEPSAQANGTATAEFVYPGPGVYLITVTIEDSAGNSAALESKFVVVYDPGAGRVSGGGWYWSGDEAYDDGDPYGNLATFGYNARYEEGQTAPSGTTKLYLIGEFFFKSTSYDYLIINDTLAVAEGVGRVGSDFGYRFRVQGIDNGWLDFFQITIWDDDTGEILYDNGVLYDEGDLVLLGGIKIRS